MSKKTNPQDPETPPGTDHKGKPAKAEKKVEAKVETPPPAKPEDRPPTPTKEELEAKAKEFTDAMFPPPEAERKPTDQKEEHEPETKPEPEPEKATETPPEKATTEKPPEAQPEPKKPEKNLPPPISESVKPEQLQAPATPAKAEPEVEQWTEDDLETLNALARMEREGKADKGIVERVKKFWADEQAYIANWEKDNPGQKFNADDDAHGGFYEKNEPAYDDSEYKRAVKANLKDDLVRQAKAEVRQEADAEDYQRRLKEQAPKTAVAVHDAMKQMIAEAGFEEQMKKDGRLVLDKSAEEAIKKASPHAHAILLEEADLLSIQVAEIDKIIGMEGRYKIDPNLSVKTQNGAHVLPHKMLTDLTEALETELASMPPEQTMREGKRFVTNAEFSAQVERILQSKATNEAKAKALDHVAAHYYTVTLEDTKAALIATSAGRAKSRIEQIGGLKKEAAASPPAKTETPAKQETAPGKPTPAKAPSAASSSEHVDTTAKGTAPVRKTAEDAAREFLG